MYSNKHVVSYEKSKSIPIQQTINKTHEYGLKQNFFDPTKSSPPNEFMLKLRMRASLYSSVDRTLGQKC